MRRTIGREMTAAGDQEPGGQQLRRLLGAGCDRPDIASSRWITRPSPEIAEPLGSKSDHDHEWTLPPPD